MDDDDEDFGSPGERRLFLARWPDGSATLLSASSLDEVADLLDEVADPGACSVVEFEGDVCFDLRLAEDPASGRFLTAEIESLDRDPCGLSLVETAFPRVREMLAQHEDMPPDSETWKRAVSDEAASVPVASAAWTRAVVRFVNQLFGPPDRTAALRQMMDVSVPREPRPETPEQQAMFEAEQRRLAQRLEEKLMPGDRAARAAKPPKKPPKKPTRPGNSRRPPRGR